jgi:hypothetical protein
MPPENGELDEQTEGRGVIPTARPRTRRLANTEKGHARNLVMPDSLYDRLCLYAQRTKVKVEIRTGPGRKIERLRSLTVSEAACVILERGLPKLRIAEDE